MFLQNNKYYKVIIIIIITITISLLIWLLYNNLNKFRNINNEYNNNEIDAEKFILNTVIPNLNYKTKPSVATSLFSEHAILLATISSKFRQGHKQIQEYFEYFLNIDGLMPDGGPYKYQTNKLSHNLYIVNVFVRFNFEKLKSIDNRMSFIIEYNNKENKFLINFLHASPLPFPLKID